NRHRKILGPLGGSAAGLANDPFTDRDDQAGFLRQRNELRWADQTLRRMWPADQRLEPVERIVAEAVERLKVQLEAALADRDAQVEFHLAPHARLLVERGLEEVIAGLAFAFGAIEREVGVLHQRGSVVAV